MDDAPIKVLVADDDGPFLEALRALIDRQPELSVVAAARNGLEAIELADAVGPDAVVIDVHMPLLDGASAVARLRRDHPSLCLIAITGDADPKLHRSVAEAGADAVLRKDELARVLVDRLAGLRAG
jgi:DNA-binding NarL/FixJ family response regulator